MIDINLSKKKEKFLKHSKINFFSAQNILITGASSGIGQSLAIASANKGKNLYLWGRSEQKLTITRKKCFEKGANVYCYIVDLVDSEQTIYQLDKLLADHTIDLTILAAGSGDIKEEENNLESSDLLFKLMHLNYVTPCLMSNKIAQHMINQHIQGHIIFISSVAGFYSLPFATAYSSSKAGLSRFADSLRIALRKWNIHVTLIIPGFVDTPMSRRLICDKPLLVPLNKATQMIIQAINKNKTHLIIPKLFNYLKWIELLAPTFLKDFILSHLKVKQD